jgi:hypothetical protein
MEGLPVFPFERFHKIFCALGGLIICGPFSVVRADGPNAEWYSTIQALSMGNAAITTASDPATAAFYNPAAVNRQKRVQLEVFNPQFEVSTGVLGLGGTNSYASQVDLEKVRPLLVDRPFRKSYMGFSVFPNVQAQNLNFGILYSMKAGAYSDGTTLFYKSSYLLIPSLALSAGTLGGRLRIGAAIRGIQATTNDNETKETTGIGYRVNANEGLGIGLDAGIIFALPWDGLPTIGLVARNIGDTSFSQKAPYPHATGEPKGKDRLPLSYDGGISISPRIGRKSKLTIAADYRDIRNAYGTSALRRINTGMEFNIARTFLFRVGVSQGYWTAGIGLQSKFGSMDLGTYSEELDRSGFRKVEDRRLSLRFGSKF